MLRCTHCCSQSVMRICGKLLFLSWNFLPSSIAFPFALLCLFRLFLSSHLTRVFYFVPFLLMMELWSFLFFFVIFRELTDNEVIYNFSLVFNRFEWRQHKMLPYLNFTSILFLYAHIVVFRFWLLSKRCESNVFIYIFFLSFMSGKINTYTITRSNITIERAGIRVFGPHINEEKCWQIRRYFTFHR